MNGIPEILPLTDNNKMLLANVHPSGWVNPEPAPSYNLVVVGAGTAGLVTAAGAAGLGAKVALIERNLMGGDCLNVGCVPSKGIIRAARAMHDVNAAGKYGIAGGERLTIDFPGAMEPCGGSGLRSAHTTLPDASRKISEWMFFSAKVVLPGLTQSRSEGKLSVSREPPSAPGRERLPLLFPAWRIPAT